MGTVLMFTEHREGFTCSKFKKGLSVLLKQKDLFFDSSMVWGC